MSSPCKIEWLVIPAKDLKAAAEFYSKIFGWKISEFSPEFWLFDADSVHGGFDINLKPNKNGVRFSITVKNIEKILDHVLDSSGDILRGKYEIAKGFGFSASFYDPNGNIVELWAKD